MAASLEYQTISKIVERQDFHTVEKRRVTENFFFSPECRQIFLYLKTHFHAKPTFGSVPSFQLISQIFPGFQYTPSNDSLDTLLDQLRLMKMGIEARDWGEKILKLAEHNPRKAAEALREAAAEMSSHHETTNDLLLSDAHDILLNDYNTVASGHGITGLPWPWAPLNDATQGMHPGEFILIFGRPKSMKCVVEGQKIMLQDGALVPIEKVPETCVVPSFTEKTGKVRWAKARRIVSGTKDSVEVITESGLKLKTSNEHLYMIPGGKYKRINELKPGDYIATARTLPEWVPTSSVSVAEATLLGMLTGDGNYTRSEVQFTTADEEILSVVKTIANQIFDCDINTGSRPIEYRIVGRENGKNKLLNRLRDLGMHGKKSVDKEVPDAIFKSSRKAIEAYLAALIDTDGHVSSTWVAWNSSSRNLIDGIQHLLMRLGIRGRIKTVETNFNTISYALYVYSKEQHIKLNDYLGEYMYLDRKRDALRRLANLDIREKRNVDAVPYSDSLMSKILTAKSDKPWPIWGGSKLDVSKLFRRTDRISRHLLNILADGFSSEILTTEASCDIIWERIDSIESIGFLPCYDICIEDGVDPNFVVEGFIVHNTWLSLYVITVLNMYANARVLVCSFEMSALQIIRRISAIRAVVNYKLLLSGKLQPADRDRFFYGLSCLNEEARMLDTNLAPGTTRTPALLVTEGDGINGVSFLHSKIREFEPDLILVDGLYLMNDERGGKKTVDWKAIAHISQDTKRTAREFKIPILATAQANRKADKDVRNADVSEIAYSDALGQDTDFSVRVGKRIDKATKEPELVMAFPGSRETDLDALLIHGIPAVNFQLKSTFVSDPDREDIEDEKPKNNSHEPRVGPTIPTARLRG